MTGQLVLVDLTPTAWVLWHSSLTRVAACVLSTLQLVENAVRPTHSVVDDKPCPPLRLNGQWYHGVALGKVIKSVVEGHSFVNASSDWTREVSWGFASIQLVVRTPAYTPRKT
jgi:hypothetical protein